MGFADRLNQPHRKNHLTKQERPCQLPSSACLRASFLASSPQPYARQHRTQILTERTTIEKRLVLPQLRAADGGTTPRGQSHRTHHMDNRLPQPETLPHARIHERRHRRNPTRKTPPPVNLSGTEAAETAEQTTETGGSSQKRGRRSSKKRYSDRPRSCSRISFCPAESPEARSIMAVARLRKENQAEQHPPMSEGMGLPCRIAARASGENERTSS